MAESNASTSVRFGIIGVGAMGLEHIRNIKLIKNAVVSAVADTDERARSEATAILPEQATVFADYNQLVSSPDVDCIIIATPNFHHIELLRVSIPSGKHIMVEKPMCTTLQDALEVEALVEEHMPPESGKLFWVGMEYRFMPPIARLLGHVDSGTLGNLVMVHIREHRFPFLKKVADWNRFTSKTGGTLVEKCCHFFDLMRRIIGGSKQPLRVFASGSIDVNHRHERYVVTDEESKTSTERTPDIIDNAYVIVEWEDGIRSCLDLCMFAEDRQHEEVLVVGSKGKVVAETPSCLVTLHHPSQNASGDNASNPRTPPAPDSYEKNTTEEVLGVSQDLLAAGYHEGATFYELEAVVQAVLASETPQVTVHDGIMAVLLGVAAELSIKEKRAIDVQELLAETRTALSETLQHAKRQKTSRA